MKPSADETLLDGLALFSALAPADRARLASALEPLSLRRGETLVRQGEEADALYIVSTGRFSVRIEGRAEPVAEIGPGQPVGEIAFIAGGRRTATVTAMRDSLVLCLGREAFETEAARIPGLWALLAAALAERLAAVNASYAAKPAAGTARPRTIAVIRAGDGPIPPAFLPRFAAALAHAAETRVVTAEDVRSLMPPRATLDCPEVTAVLNALESGAGYVVYAADAELTPWSEKAIRQADLVLAAGAHGADPAPNALERCAEGFLPSSARRLVLVHPTRGPIAGTRRWLAQRSVAQHHHVALDDGATFDRLARFIHGRALGLVACGGGAFCPAHTGVYAALLEAGLAVDATGGTSAGSAFAAAFAMGIAPDDIARATHDIFVTNRAMRRMTWPRYGLLDHAHFDRQLARYFGGRDIEDLWIPFFAVSADLSRYDVHCHREGDLFAAVRASASIPALLPPLYTAAGHMLVDGCLLDNVPVRAMHRIKTGPNVVIALEPPALERFAVDYASLPGRRALLVTALSLRHRSLPKAPGPLTVLLRSLSANRQDFLRYMTPEDALLVPPVPADMGFLDWHRHRELMGAARAWARGEIARLKMSRHPCLADHEEAPCAADTDGELSATSP